MGKPRIRLHNIGFGLALLVILLLLAQARRTQEDLLRSNQAFSRSAEVLTTVQDTLSALQDVETGMRGYVITGADAFLQPYHEGNRRLVQARARLRQLAGSQRDAAWWGRANHDIDERLRLAKVNVDLRRRAGLEAASQSVAQAGGKEAMDRVRSLLGELEAAERERMIVEGRAVERRVAEFRRWTTWGTAVALVLLAAALLSVHRSLVQRRQALHLARAFFRPLASPPLRCTRCFRT